MYVVYKDIIKKNVMNIKDAFEKYGLNLELHYSYKTNSMPDVLMFMDKFGVLPEVVSQYEMLQAIWASDVVHGADKRIICNGVAMSYKEIANNMIRFRDRFLVNFNDIATAAYVREELRNQGCYDRFNIGVRVRFDDKSRFGILENDVRLAIDRLEALGFDVISLHCHVTATREPQLYRNKVRQLVNVAKKINRIVSLNFGGSMYGSMPEKLASQFDNVCDFEEYAKIIAEEVSVLKNPPLVIIEPGTALVGNAISVIGKVIRSDEYGRVILDVDKYTIGMLKNKELVYTFIPKGEAKKSYKRKINVYGCTCIEDDLLIKDFEYEPQIGDEIEFSNCGAYSYCFEPDFIIPKQEVIVR